MKFGEFEPRSASSGRTKVGSSGMTVGTGDGDKEGGGDGSTTMVEVGRLELELGLSLLMERKLKGRGSSAESRHEFGGSSADKGRALGFPCP